MAFKYNVTRTISTNMVNCLCINLSTAEPFNKDFAYDGNAEDKQKTLKTLRRKYENDEFSIASIVDVRQSSELYGMTEDDFIKYATILDPKTRKPYGETESEETETEDEEPTE